MDVSFLNLRYIYLLPYVYTLTKFGFTVVKKGSYPIAA